MRKRASWPPKRNNGRWARKSGSSPSNCINSISSRTDWNSRRATENHMRAEFERKSGALQAEVVRLQQELEHHRSATNPPLQQQTHEADSPKDDSSGGPNSWKMVAGASLLLGSVASAAAYWNAARDGVQNRVAADTAISGAARHSGTVSVADSLETPVVDPFAALPLPAASGAQALVESQPDRHPIAAPTAATASRHSGDPGNERADALANLAIDQMLAGDNT